MIPNTASSGSGVLKNRKNVVPGSALTIGVLAQNNSRAVATRATGTRQTAHAQAATTGAISKIEPCGHVAPQRSVTATLPVVRPERARS